MAAVTLLRRLQSECRPATTSEQAVLARWGGWGAQGVWQVLDEQNHPEFAADRSRLAEVLDASELAAARLTTINAHYTDAALVAAIWRAVEDLGFTGGRVLEPGCGAGTFIGLAPAAAVMTGVELDPTTAAIASYLYPDATIRGESFADTRFPTGHFDVAIGNVPFADVVLHDPRYNQGKLTMHNHFLVKSLEMVRPGGVVALLTSRYTMDAANPAARRAIADRADLVAAIRLPSKAHWRAAGTEAVTDLLILRRREPDRAPADPGWLITQEVPLTGPGGATEQVRINSYWQAHPDHVLGTPAIEVGMYGTSNLVIKATVPLEEVPQQLAVTLADVTEQATHAGLVVTPRTSGQETAAAGWVPAAREAVDGQLIARADGSFAVVEDGGETSINVPKAHAVEVRALLGLCDQTRQLIDAEAACLDDTAELEEARQALLGSWRRYVDRYGPINRYSLRNTGRRDPDTDEQIQARVTPPAVRLVTRSTFGTVVSALEVFDDLTQTAEPAGLMRHRLIVPRSPVQGVESAADGLAVVLDQLGRVDVDAIAELMGVDRERAIAELADLVYELPDGNGEWQTRAHYASGNVRHKLDAARAAETAEPGRWSRHVALLESVMPDDLLAGDLTPRLGAVWIPDTDHQDFLRELLHDRHDRVKVIQVSGSDWQVDAPKWGVEATEEWGTDRMPAGRIMEALIAQRKIAVYDTQPDKSQVFNPTATEAAQEKARLMTDRFTAWVWEDPERSMRLLADYNRRFNSTVLRDYSAEGELLTLPGLAKNFTPAKHQRTAVARMINEPCVGLFHEVGAGKTAEMVIGATELRRLGLIQKPAVVVPNHMLEQFSREWLQLYPQATILAASSDDLATDNRRRFISRIATNDWDAIILTRTAFERLSLSPANEAAYQDRELALTRERLLRVKEAHGEGAVLKRLEKTMLRAEERLKELRDTPTDPDLYFEQTGIDYLLVDELHHYKNLTTTSSIGDATITGSKRASDLHAKIDYLRQSAGERVATGATATPIANSITEMWVMQRYLDPAALNVAGIHDFDSWAATFGEVVTVTELSVASSTAFKVKNRFARFVNVPELLTMFHRFGDVKTAADLDLPRPQIAARAADGRRVPQLITVPASDDLASYIRDLGERAEMIHNRQVEPTQDNMLKLSGDARKAALDMRLIHPTNHPAPGKIDAAADHLARVWESTRNNRYLDPDTGEQSPIPGALQIVFCDLGTPSANWNVYDGLRDALIARGLPPSSIRFIHDAKSDADKAKLFAACRTGHVAVIIGSTEKMGVGTNIQNRAIHLMDLDAPWRPADVEQRHGRILRQGNQNPEVQITQVVTEGSFDAFMWQTLERKSRFIAQVMTGRLGARESGDIGDSTLSYAETKAVSSGNPLLLDLADVEQELGRLTRLETAHATSERTLERTITHSQQSLNTTRHNLDLLQNLLAQTQPTANDQFRMHIEAGPADRPPAGSTDSRTTAATHLAITVDWILTRTREAVVAQLGGHTITAAGGYGWSRADGQIATTTWTVQGSNGLVSTTTTHALSDRTARRVDRGTITRLENLVASIPSHIRRAHDRIAELENTIAQADRIRGKPFRHAAALAAARTRYATITNQIKDLQDQPHAIPEGAQAATEQGTVAQQRWETVDATGTRLTHERAVTPWQALGGGPAPGW